MIQLIPDLPSDTVGLRALGDVTADDYREVVDPALSAALDHHDTINIVYELGDGLGHFTLGGLEQDARVGMRSRPSQWGRVALVTDHTGIKEAVHFFTMFYSMNIRFFDPGHDAEAIAWATGTSS